MMVTANTVTSLDLEGHESIQTPTIPVTKGNVAVKAIVVESEADGTIKKDADGNFIPTGETLAGVTVKSPKDKQLTDELVNQIMTALNTGNYMSLTQIPGITSEIGLIVEPGCLVACVALLSPLAVFSPKPPTHPKTYPVL